MGDIRSSICRAKGVGDKLPRMSASTQPLTFWRRGGPVTLGNVPPERTLLQVLREDLGLTDVKEGCNEGDCGACTVVLAELEHGQVRHRAVNSCIRLAHSAHGLAVLTAADLPADDGTLHPVQESMVRHHGSQCGFCTPGFVMSLYALYQHTRGGQGISRERAQADLSGNLCRCTGYRPILDAAQSMGTLPRAPGCGPDPDTLHAALQAMATGGAPGADDALYLRPETLDDLLRLRARHPQAQLVAGCTDVGLWITKQLRQFDRILDLTRVEPLRRIEAGPEHLTIGAAVRLTDAFDALLRDWPGLQTFAQRFAGLPVRNAGTLGGNVANGSPIGDSMPLLIALGARVELGRWLADADGGQAAHRELALEDLYSGYRTNVMRPDEVLTRIKVPRPPGPDEHDWLRVYKISKRFDDDISAVCLAIRLRVHDGVVVEASVGAGGVAAVPSRAHRTEAALRGQPWNEATVAAARAAIGQEFQPISDMRASASHRRALLGNLLQRFWLETQGLAGPTLDQANARDLETLA